MNTVELTDAVMLAASDAGHRLFRNNSGVAKHVKGGKTWHVRYGVGTTKGGGGDLIGWTRTGRFASLELKVGDDKRTIEQKTWHGWVIAGGGVSGEVRTVEDAMRILEAGC